MDGAGLRRNFQSTWVAVAFGLCVGVAMVYVPYQFGAPGFRYIYPYARWLGAAFLSGALLVGVAAMYPRWWRAVDWIGRLLLGGALAVFWFNGSVRTGTPTGIVVYPLLFAALVLEAFPGFVRRFGGTFAHLTALVGLLVGGLMMTPPAHGWLGAPRWQSFAAGAVLLALSAPAAWWVLRRQVGRAVPFLAALAIPFALLTALLHNARSWTGAAMYLTFASAALVYAGLPRLKWAPSIRWRLWRGMVVASCVPLLALGGLASVLTQRAIESQALEDATQAVQTEVEWLQEGYSAVHDALVSHAALRGFRQALRERDEDVLALSVQLAGHHTGAIEALYVTDAEGRVLARTDASIPATPAIADRDFFQRAQVDGFFVSAPYLAKDGVQRVSAAVGMKDEQGPLGVLVGTLAVDQLSARQLPASGHYAVKVLDRRSGGVVRAAGPAFSQWLPPTLAGSLTDAESGSFVGSDDEGNQTLVAWARVPGTEWLVLARQDVAEAFAFVNRLGVGAVALVTGAALLALLLSQLVANEVTRRLRRVREAAEDLAQGDLRRRVDPEGNDELTLLADAFNDMATRVEQAQTQLQSAVELRDEFLSMASHELRTPLTPLKATAQALRRMVKGGIAQADPQKVMAMLERVDRQTERLAVLVSDMLDTSRIQSGRFTLKPEQMDLCALVREVVERVQSVSDDNAQRLVLAVPDEPVSGVWDGQRLEQVVVNLVENAFRYSPQGGPILVTVSADGRAVRLTVADQGIGIPEDSLAHLFEPYYRASNAAARHFGGLGLGLHICREIAERHGGRIWAESDGAEQGARFHLELPYAAPAQTRTGTAAA